MPSNPYFDVPIPPSERGQPAWAIATLFPTQGNWTEKDYFRLEADGFVELANGCIEVLPMPTWLHQRIVRWLSRQFEDWATANRRGEVLFAPLPLKLFPGTIREPDILLVESSQWQGELTSYPTSALLVVEVVSEGEDARHRDLVTKRADYAQAGIPEYWIVDPLERAITVLTLVDGCYSLHGRFESGQAVTSRLLGGFVIDCNVLWSLAPAAGRD